ncbi:hypothetical protein DJ70_08525 [Halorubrum halodurans]|uniref:Uncharacterized protein n=1 Tax=Halorubrum halodurans TaxID=1383851 RepID=A0A256IK58_9EURY|nr:hypothetical protein DJ70_08525 [Halorubrum halodurans]
MTKTRNGRKVLLGLATDGHAYSEIKIDEFSPESDITTSKSIPDLVIQLGGKLVIAIEAKDGGFSRTQLENHARWLGAESFETVTWRDLAGHLDSLQNPSSGVESETKSINGTTIPSNSVKLLLRQYERVLRTQLVPESRVIASSEYSTGENYVKYQSDVGNKHLNDWVGDDSIDSPPVPVAICFRASGENTNGDRLWFTREEWLSLLKSINKPAYHRGLSQGDLSSIVTDYNPSNDEDITIAHIEDSAGNEKMIRYGTGGGDRDSALLYMTRSTAQNSPLRQPPMYNVDEFDKLIADNLQIKHLFTNPEKVFDELQCKV